MVTCRCLFTTLQVGVVRFVKAISLFAFVDKNGISENVLAFVDKHVKQTLSKVRPIFFCGGGQEVCWNLVLQTQGEQINMNIAANNRRPQAQRSSTIQTDN